MQKLIVASQNQHKVAEISTLIKEAGLHFDVQSIGEMVPNFNPAETGNTFEANALIKAHAAYEATNELVLADDSGLEVDALNGAPGVISARYAGEPTDDAANNEKLLKAMQDVPKSKRQARFVSVVALLGPDGGEEKLFRGTIEGEIGFDLRGEHGFGYDPLFILAGQNRTLAEVPFAEKNTLSHRFKAMQQAIAFLANR